MGINSVFKGLNLPEVEERKLSSTLLSKLCVHYANGFDAT